MRNALIASLWIAEAFLMSAAFITHREAIGDEWPGFLILVAAPLGVAFYVLRAVTRRVGRRLLLVLASSSLLVVGLVVSLVSLSVAIVAGPHVGPAILAQSALLETILLLVVAARLWREAHA